MNGSVALTKETYEKLQSELDLLKKVDRPAVIQDIDEARAQGDLKENAEYHAAKDRQGEIEDRIRYLEDRIARADIIELNPADSKHIIFGAKVTVKNLNTEKTLEYTLVSPDAIDVINGFISSSSPIGKALIGSKRGEIVEVTTPRGLMKLEIIDYK